MTQGSAPSLSVLVDGATNRITTSGFAYDANGDMTAMPGVTGIASDVRNRLTAAGGDEYSYRPDNKRLWKKLPGGAEEVYFYLIAGEKLGTYEPTLVDTTLYLKFKSTNVYYAGTLIRSEGQAVVVDRLGSVRSFGGTVIWYFPYGEEQTSTANDRQKFGTYCRDASTELDYADQRYYGSGMGRFLTPDPYQGSGSAGDPGSWNRSTYVGSDPVNANDPTGLCMWCAQLEAPPNLDGSGGGIIWRSEAPWGSGWLHDPRFYGPGAISPLSAGINCHFIIRTGEDPYCGVWRITVYADIAAGVAWGVAAGAGGGDGGSQEQPSFECRFERYETEEAGYGEGEVDGKPTPPGYHQATRFHFRAVGGTGAYIWSNAQQESIVGTVYYLARQMRPDPSACAGT